MKTFALVPAKALANAKTRLAPALSEAQRADLSLAMLRHVLAEVRETEGVVSYAVVSGDKKVQALAEELGVAAIDEHEGSLNRGLERGRQWAIESGAEALLVVLSALPL